MRTARFCTLSLATAFTTGLMFTPGSMAQGVLDKFKARVDQATKKVEQTGKSTQQQPTPPPQSQPPRQPGSVDPTGDPTKGSAEETARLAAAAGVFDIVGIKLGMPAKDAVALLRAADPKVAITADQFRFEGFGNTDLVGAVQASYPVSPGTETVVLLFALPPNPQVVIAMERHVVFDPAKYPLLANIVAAVRQKYGQATKAEGQDHYWLYDTGGRPLGGAIAQFPQSCIPEVGFSTGRWGITNGYKPRPMMPSPAGPVDCSVATVLTARFHEAGGNYRDGRVVPPGLLDEFWVSASSEPLRRSAMNASHAVALDAARNREAREKDEADKRGAPKL